MSTEALFRENAHLRECPARVVSIDERGIRLDRTVFYPQGGGQAGDGGELLLPDGAALLIADTRKGEMPGEIVHVPAEGQAQLLSGLQAGQAVTARIDWSRRHMRFHSAEHLLCALVLHPVDGCSCTEGRRGRAPGSPKVARIPSGDRLALPPGEGQPT